MYLCEDTDIPENFLNAGNYEDILVVGGSAKGRKNLNVISSSRINGLTFSWNDETVKFYRELLVDIEKQNAIEMECVSSRKGMPDINSGKQDYFHFPELTTDDWDIYNQDRNKFSLVHPFPLDPSKEVNSVNLLETVLSATQESTCESNLSRPSENLFLC